MGRVQRRLAAPQPPWPHGATALASPRRSSLWRMPGPWRKHRQRRGGCHDRVPQGSHLRPGLMGAQPCTLQRGVWHRLRLLCSHTRGDVADRGPSCCGRFSHRQSCRDVAAPPQPAALARRQQLHNPTRGKGSREDKHSKETATEGKQAQRTSRWESRTCDFLQETHHNYT